MIKTTLKDLPKIEGQPAPDPILGLTVGFRGSIVILMVSPLNNPALVIWSGEFTKDQAAKTAANIIETLERMP